MSTKFLEILFQDSDIVLLNKPSGLASQPSVDKKRGDILSSLKSQLKTEDVFLHHRLDIGTSGVMFFSINPEVNKKITEFFRDKQFKKTYLAIAKGKMKSGKSWEIKNYLKKTTQSGRQIMRSVKSGGDPAQTLFKCHNSTEKYCLLQAQPLTGRTHQIRVHLAEAQHPILGDPLYGGHDSQAPRLMLHAQSLEFTHPRNGKTLKIEAPLPSEFSKVLVNLGLC